VLFNIEISVILQWTRRPRIVLRQCLCEGSRKGPHI